MTKLNITFCVVQIRKFLGALPLTMREFFFLINFKLKHVARRYKSS